MRYSIATKPILVAASVVSPYEAPSSSVLISLQDSEDYSHYRMVASTVPVSDPKHGGTTVLRELLGLLAGPQPINVITHLLQTAKARNEQMQNQLNPPALDKHIQEDVDSAYVYIVGAVSQALAAGQRRELAKLTKKLVEVPWVMVERVQRFVAPCDLVFDSEEEHGKVPYCCPSFYCCVGGRL